MRGHPSASFATISPAAAHFGGPVPTRPPYLPSLPSRSSHPADRCRRVRLFCRLCPCDRPFRRTGADPSASFATISPAAAHFGGPVPTRSPSLPAPSACRRTRQPPRDTSRAGAEGREGPQAATSYSVSLCTIPDVAARALRASLQHSSDRGQSRCAARPRTQTLPHRARHRRCPTSENRP